MMLRVAARLLIATALLPELLALGADDVLALKTTFARVGFECSKKVGNVFEEHYLFADRDLGCEVLDANSEHKLTSSIGGNFLVDLIFLREALCEASGQKTIPQSTEVVCYQAQGNSWPRSEVHAARRETHEFLGNQFLRGVHTKDREVQFYIERKSDGSLQQVLEFKTPYPAEDRRLMNFYLLRRDNSSRLSLQEINGELFMVHKETRIAMLFRRTFPKQTEPIRASGFSGSSGKGATYGGGGR